MNGPFFKWSYSANSKDNWQTPQMAGLSLRFVVEVWLTGLCKEGAVFVPHVFIPREAPQLHT